MTASKEERLRKVAQTIMRLAFQETERAIDMASAGKLWPWCRSMDAAAMIDILYAEEIGRLRAALEPFATPHFMGDQYVRFAPRLLEAAREALSRGLDDEGNGASNASQAALHGANLDAEPPAELADRLQEHMKLMWGAPMKPGEQPCQAVPVGLLHATIQHLRSAASHRAAMSESDEEECR